MCVDVPGTTTAAEEGEEERAGEAGEVEEGDWPLTVAVRRAATAMERRIRIGGPGRILMRPLRWEGVEME